MKSALLNPPLRNLKLAKRYSKAMVDIAKEKNIDLDTMYDEMKFIQDLIGENAELKGFLMNPVISSGDKNELLAEIFKGKISDETLNFLQVLSFENRLNILDDILYSMKEDINGIKNILETFVISATELDCDRQNLIKTKLQNKFQKEIRANFIKDESILGGIIIKINDTVIDLSLKKKIENLKNYEL